MHKKRVAILSILLIAVVAAVTIAVSVFLLPKHHEPYSQTFSSLEKAPDFSLGGENRYFDNLKSGEENVLLFWGSWCPHCESLIEKIDQADEADVIKKNLFTVAQDENLDDIESHRGDFPIYLDQDRSVYNSYELEHIPTVFIVTDQGGIIGSAQGEEDSFKLLNEYVQYNK
ncbi:TlpA family protein disulfide reductase [Eggerthella timonensis]|uniref:TlpA family protein disulfide reductase n=1 Tax=Eggerthella timonensis TaxID=1871008 RepID=UPI000C769A0E|nr:TlpA disulfide reductase family protein [Eggerthella timonensis]